MKYLMLIISILLLPVLCLGQLYEIEAVSDSTQALKITTYSQDSLENVQYLTGELDSAAFESRLFGFIFEYRNGQALRLKQNKDFENAATSINSLLTDFAYTDSTYFEWTQANYSNQYLASGVLPNYLIRVGSAFYWAKCYIAGNGLLRMELTDNTGSFLNPRDNAVMYLYGIRSFRMLALDVIGEQVDFTLIKDTGDRKIWEGRKDDDTLIRINQFTER